MKKVIIICVLFCAVQLGYATDSFKRLQLDNGLTVYLWEDKNQPDVTGRVVVRAGSIDEPKDYTGLAHYLEHVLFKGTEKIGALNWEKEKPHYDNIVKMYDELAITTDPVKRDTLTQQINRESLAAAKYTKTSEFSNLIEGVIGGNGLNAGTSYDMTVFFNKFPAFQMEKWLDVSSERFINPVFRSFQAELENVFEEYNMYQDSRSTHINNVIFSSLYPNVPYSRDIIGTADHLKNPRLSKLIEFYNTWYVPSNMALIIVGNFDSDKVIPLVKEKFGRLKAKAVPDRQACQPADFSRNPVYKAKISYYPQVVWGFQGVKKGHPDELLLDVCSQLLSNSAKTGLLDKLSLNGDISSASVYNDARREDGRVLVISIPYYDINQRLYESDKATEKIVFSEIEKLRKGEIEEWSLKAAKDAMLRQYELMFEDPDDKTELLTELFVYNLKEDYLSDYKNRLSNITMDDVKRVAAKYFGGNKVTVSIEQGEPKKNKLKKPEIKPIDQPAGESSEYAKQLRNIPLGNQPETYNDLSSTQNSSLYDGIRLHYTPNPQNDIFSMVIRYGVGVEKMPKLKYAAPLMNYAGIMPSSDAKEVRKQYSQLGAQSSFSVTDDYLYVRVFGKEENLAEVCKMISRQILLPKLENKQLDQVKGNELQARYSIEKSDASTLANAMMEYALYKDKSAYLDRLSDEKVYGLQISELTGEIIRATNYEADIFYVGRKPLTEVEKTLKENLPLKEGIVKSESPVVKERVTYDQPTIYFMPNTDAQQAKIYFYINGPEYKIEDEIMYDAFYQYFSGGFNGLVMDEIREKNSMAYTSYGHMSTPPVQNKKSYFVGYIGTQNDKVTDAIALYLKLLENMPLYPERIDNVKNYIKQIYLSAKPTFRNQSQTYESWKLLGYTDDPAKINIPKINNLTFDNIVDFYNKNIKGKPITIVITGDPKTIDLKKIEYKAKVMKLSPSSLFGGK
jgi:predicted Zn-dependent peptidase